MLSWSGNESAVLTAMHKSAPYMTMLQIDFPDEAAATAFVTAMPKERQRVPAGPFNVKTTGVWLIVIGMGIVAYFYFVFSTVVEAGNEEVYNIGLMNDRTTGIIIGVAACVVGTALWLSGRNESRRDS